MKRKYVLLAGAGLAVVLAAGAVANAQMQGPGLGPRGGGMQEQAGPEGMRGRGMGHGMMGGGMRGHMGHGGHMGGGPMGMAAGGHDMGQGHGIGQGRGMGHGGPGHGMGPGMRGMMGGSATSAEMQELHTMFVNHDRIKRTVANLPNGIRTVTESDDPEMTAILLSHVAGMLKRVEEGRNPRLSIQSPHLEVIFRNKDKIKTEVESTAKGIIVTQTSDDAVTVTALQKHAADVNDLVRRGMVAAHETMRRNAGQAMVDHMEDHGGFERGPQRPR